MSVLGLASIYIKNKRRLSGKFALESSFDLHKTTSKLLHFVLFLVGVQLSCVAQSLSEINESQSLHNLASNVIFVSCDVTRHSVIWNRHVSYQLRVNGDEFSGSPWLCFHAPRI